MKVVTKEEVMEEVKYFCDNHPDKECFSELKTMSWYGSCYDMMAVEIHLCDECMKDLYIHLNEKYKKEPEEIDLI